MTSFVWLLPIADDKYSSIDTNCNSSPDRASNGCEMASLGDQVHNGNYLLRSRSNRPLGRVRGSCSCCRIHRKFCKATSHSFRSVQQHCLVNHCVIDVHMRNGFIMQVTASVMKMGFDFALSVLMQLFDKFISELQAAAWYGDLLCTVSSFRWTRQDN